MFFAMKEVPVSQGRAVFREDEDFEWINSEGRRYAVRRDAGECFDMHRVIREIAAARHSAPAIYQPQRWQRTERSAGEP